jgi:hypothetical protein
MQKGLHPTSAEESMHVVVCGRLGACIIAARDQLRDLCT